MMMMMMIRRRLLGILRNTIVFLAWWTTTTTICLVVAASGTTVTPTSSSHEIDNDAMSKYGIDRSLSPPPPPPPTPQLQAQQQQQQSQQPPKQPNFIIILTDDLDWTLGGTHASTLRQTRQLIGDEGKTFTNWFVQTPVCCPSRAQLLTGKMNHNLRLPSLDAGHGCMHIDVESNVSHPFYQRDYFAQYFQQLNYTVGIFGKHLNNGNPTDFLPPGVDEMLINGGGVYLDPTFTVGTRGETTTTTTTTTATNNTTPPPAPPRSVTFDNCTETTGMSCYSTSIIGNASLAWIRRHTERHTANMHSNGNENSSSSSSSSSSSNHDKQKQKPFLALISVKAPHILDGPEHSFPKAIPAPWYENATIPEERAPRTPNYNVSAATTKHHHWIVRNQLPLTQEEGQQVDELYVSRLKTLMSVDDLVVDLIQQLQETSPNGLLENTYIVFTSDNGYRLGQFRMPMCKLHAYENDIRVPMMIRGPHIRPNTTSSILSTHVNLMPTLLGLAQLQLTPPPPPQPTKPSNEESTAVVPKTMDGTNLASYVVDIDDEEASSEDKKEDDTTTRTSSSSRPHHHSSSLLIEYLSLGNVFRYNHTIDTYNHSFLALRMIQTHHEEYDEEEGGEDENDSNCADAAGGSSEVLQRHHWMYSYDFSKNKEQQQQQEQGNVDTASAASEEEGDEHVIAQQSRRSGTLFLRPSSSSITSATIHHHNNIIHQLQPPTPQSQSAQQPHQEARHLLHNLKYIEYRDSRHDWNATGPPLERELFDLDRDPHELHNLLGSSPPPSGSGGGSSSSTISPLLIQALQWKIQRLVHCQGDSCRREQQTGVLTTLVPVLPVPAPESGTTGMLWQKQQQQQQQQQQESLSVEIPSTA